MRKSRFLFENPPCNVKMTRFLF
ncbi:hypothetical protein CP061683_2432A, partial [Chlamydia psittaci 06-1683]